MAQADDEERLNDALHEVWDLERDARALLGHIATAGTVECMPDLIVNLEAALLSVRDIQQLVSKLLKDARRAK